MTLALTVGLPVTTRWEKAVCAGGVEGVSGLDTAQGAEMNSQHLFALCQESDGAPHPPSSHLHCRCPGVSPECTRPFCKCIHVPLHSRRFLFFARVHPLSSSNTPGLQQVGRASPTTPRIEPQGLGHSRCSSSVS